MTSQQPVDIHEKSHNRSLLVGVLLIGTFCTVLNQTPLTTVSPILMEELGISASSVQWPTTGFLLANSIMIPISAWLINKFSPEKLYITAVSTFLIGTIICLVAQDFGMLLTGRLVQVAGVGVSMPLLQTIMLSIFPLEKHGVAIDTTGTAIGLAPTLGLTLPGWIIDSHIWCDPSGMVIPIVVLVLILASFLMKNVIQLFNPSIDVLSVILSTLGFGSLLYGFSSVGDKGWGSPQVYGFLIVGAIVLCFFAYRQLHLEQPFLELRVSKPEVFTVTATLSGVTSMAMIGAKMVLPLYTQNIRGESAFHSGLMLLPGALVMGLMMPVIGRIFDKVGARRLVIIGMFISIAVTLPFVFLTKATPIIYIIVLYAIRMFGISMAMMPAIISGMNALPTNLLSHGTTVDNTLRQIASSIGTTVLISVLTNVTKDGLPVPDLLKTAPFTHRDQAINATLNGYHAALFVATILGVLGLVITFFLNKREAMPAKEVGVTK